MCQIFGVFINRRSPFLRRGHKRSIRAKKISREKRRLIYGRIASIYIDSVDKQFAFSARVTKQTCTDQSIPAPSSPFICLLAFPTRKPIQQHFFHTWANAEVYLSMKAMWEKLWCRTMHPSTLEAALKRRANFYFHNRFRLSKTCGQKSRGTHPDIDTFLA